RVRNHINKLINKLEIEELDASLKYFRAAKNEKPLTRNTLYVINDAILLNQKQMLKDKQISVDTYVKYAIQAYDFCKPEAKLKDNCDDIPEAESFSDDSDERN
ncbi:unnamed protein product, partial [Brachionus calyciflorus]